MLCFVVVFVIIIIVVVTTTTTSYLTKTILKYVTSVSESNQW